MELRFLIWPYLVERILIANVIYAEAHKVIIECFGWYWYRVFGALNGRARATYLVRHGAPCGGVPFTFPV